MAPYTAVGFVCDYKPRKVVHIQSPQDVQNIMGKLASSRREIFCALLLNARHELQKRHTVSVGNLNASIVHPREVFRPAIIEGACAIILVHNHPSGDCEPSEEDLLITRRLVDVGKLVGIEVQDHVILPRAGICSLAARGLL